MNISFLKAQRESLHSVKATYTLDDTEFTVEWNNICPATGKIGNYDLQLETTSEDNTLAIRVDDAIREGESDENPDLELYLAIRDTFDQQDCLHFWDNYELQESALDVSYDEDVEGTHVVDVVIGNSSFKVNCQTYMTHDYKESRGLSCVNDSGGDIHESGLAGYLETLGIDIDSDIGLEIQKRIEDCAEEHLPENTVLRVLREKMSDDTISLKKSLFGAFGPTDVHHYQYVNSDGDIIVTSEDTSEILAEKVLLGYSIFSNTEDYETWLDEVNPENRYGDCSVSYRAWQSITGNYPEPEDDEQDYDDE